MKRFLLVLIGAVAVVTLMTLPASAADFKFGGMFWTKYYSTSNTTDGNDKADDNLNGFYTRMRLYFTATASENLMAVFKYEIDDVWGAGRLGSTSTDGGSLARSDNSTQAGANSGGEVKNAYIQFNMPNTPLTFLVGALPAKLGSGLAFNDDTNGIVALAKFDPVKVALVYSRLNDASQPSLAGVTTSNAPIYTALNSVVSAFSASQKATFTPYSSSDNWDLWAGEIRFAASKELSFTLSPTWVHTVVKDTVGFSGKNDFDLVNVVLDADWKGDVFGLYFTGGKNFGSMDTDIGSLDFKGWQLEAGGTFDLKPVVIGVDGYYSSGQKYNKTNDVKSYLTPGVDGRNTYNMDEIVFPGWFDDYSATISGTFTGINGSAFNNQTNLTATGMTRTNQGYVPTNIWAIGAHVDFKPLEKTLIQAGGAYMQFVEKVPATTTTGLNSTSSGAYPVPGGDVTKQSDKLGTSLYLRLSQGIVDGLELKAAFGYLFADDGFTPNDKDDNAYKFATGLFWSW
jgi:hypothetical protein